MTSSTPVKLGCLAALAMAISLPGWSATHFSPANQPLGSIAPIVLSNDDLSGGATKAYRPWFENGSWQGDLVEYTVTATGGLSTSVSFAQSSPTNTGANWSALVNFAATDKDTYWDTGRNIITFNGSTQVPFRFTEDGIGTENMKLLDPTAAKAERASNILNFVRGDRSNEYPNPDGAQLRHRTSILGDIIHSKPVYVGAPNDIRTDNSYAAWAKADARKKRAPRIYVGANDGMLHVFDAANGKEVYAYVPSMLIGKLGLLTARPYPHTYYVDGEMSVRDAYFGGAWHTVLAGSLGAGGKGFFALDVTDPGLSGEASNTGNDKKVLFEHSTSVTSPDNDLGDSFSRPIIAKLNDGHWYVVIGNGYNGASGVAKLYLVNLDTLAVIKLSTNSGTADNPNGLSSPSLLDTDRNGTADYAYVGDIDGNLWKFDLSPKNPRSWKVAYDGVPLYPTAGNQPITQAPQITLHPRYGYMVYFATGRLFTVGDLTDTSVQSLYGIWDSGNPPPDADEQSLLEQTWDGPKTYNYLDTGDKAADQTIAIYNPDAGPINWNTHYGWKVDFPAGGYRALQPVQVQANRVKATVYKPVVDQQGENWLVEALLTDGGPNPPAAPIYDLNVDRRLDSADLFNDKPDAKVKEWHVPMMWRQVDGIMSQVTIGYIASGTDTLFINYLQPSVVISEPCTESCPEGFFNGHIDVQTYLGSAPLGGKFTWHTHLYDKKTARVYVDFFDLNVPKEQGEQTPLRDFTQLHIEINSTGPDALNPPSNIASDEEFIVLVANADLSPGGTLEIGTKTWNVLNYQIQLHKALKNWDPGVSGSVPVDSDGKSLVFNWKKIKDDAGTIRISFNDRAILDGGLHPTQSECVLPNAYGGGTEPKTQIVHGITYDPVTKIGRWRNGALTFQLVKKSYFTDHPVNPALAMVDIQKPVDLRGVGKDGDREAIPMPDGTELFTIIDISDDLYGRAGGLLTQHAAEHIWESSLFWHFGDLSQFTSLGRPCYGDANWEEAVALEQDHDPITATLAKRGDDLTAETLAAAVEALDQQGCSDKTKACYSQWDALKKILNLSDDYKQPPEENDDDPDTDLPVVIEGGSTGAGLEGDGGDGSITEGSSYKPGRMSWTDIVK